MDRDAGSSPGSRHPFAAQVGYACLVACFAVALASVDRSGSDTANQGTLLLLAVFAATLGALHPRQAWLSALIMGSTIAVVRAVALLLGQLPTDPQAPHSVPAAATLLILVVPAAVAAYLGAAARHALKPSSRSRRPNA